MQPSNLRKILTVVGARPNFMKAAPIIAAVKAHNERATNARPSSASAEPQFVFQNVLVHTGQHYDEAMSDRFFADLNIPRPDVHLGVGSGSHAVQTAEVMKRFEEVLLKECPDLLIVVGDVNSTIGCALVASKISFDSAGTRPLIAHVEAGLRSFDRGMPEEINRILTDHLADLLFVTEESGLKNLRDEGIPDHKVHFVGNTMIDSLLAFKDRAEHSDILDRLALRDTTNGNGEPQRYALLTLHRPSNVDERATFLNILEGLQPLSASHPVIFPVHPRTRKRIAGFGLERYFAVNGNNGLQANGASGLRLIEPLGYLDFLCLMAHAALVVTDSGGIQEETTCLRVPCVTVRENTERPVTVTVGTNLLAGTSKEGIRAATQQQLTPQVSGGIPEAWDGKSSERILDVISREFARRSVQSPLESVQVS